MNQSLDELRKKLTPEQIDILVNKGTDVPFSGKYVHYDQKGMYVCAACGSTLFSSNTKYDSGCGWPSFYDVVEQGNVKLQDDTSHGMNRTEVVCATCGGYLGHVFHDGPKEKTGLRYCINSTSLDFKEK